MIIASIIMFWITRRLEYSKMIMKIVLFLLMTVSIATAGGKYGLGSLYFLASYSVFFIILDYKTGVILPLYYLVGFIVRLSLGNFYDTSIMNNPIIAKRFITVLSVATAFGITGSFVIQILVNYLGKEHAKAIDLEIASRLKECGGEIKGRWNESIFMIVLKAETRKDLDDKIRMLKSIINKTYNVYGINRSVLFSYAVSRTPDDGISPDNIRSNVLNILEKEKLIPGEIIYFDEESKLKELYKFSVSDALNCETLQDELKLFYQPKVRISDKKCIGAEVLLRWENKHMGFISPGDFIPIAEKNGAVRGITRWVIEKTFKDISENRDKIRNDFSFAINLSVADIKDPTLMAYIKSMIKKYSIITDNIEFEVTESIQADNDPTIEKTLGELLEAGFKIAIDDFGTGYSSLSYLHKIKATNLKIDQSFVQQITDTEESYPVVDAVISLAHSMNLGIIAEGIETKEQYYYLMERNCEVAQGWLFSKAITLDDLLKFK